MIRVVGLTGVLIALALPMAAFAMTLNGQTEMRNWAMSDKCVAAAKKQFPDYTADSLAKRDAALQQCLTAHNLPPRAPLAPQPSPQQ